MLLALVTACGGGGDADYGFAQQPAAEPGEAPERAGQVPGRLLEVGDEPEGIVVTDAGVAVVAVRGADGLALVDLDTGLLRRVPMPSAARHLSLAAPGGPVLVPLEGTDELLLVDPVAGQVVDRVGDLPRNPHDTVQHPDGTISVTDELGGGTYFVRPDSEVQCGVYSEAVRGRNGPVEAADRDRGACQEGGQPLTSCPCASTRPPEDVPSSVELRWRPDVSGDVHEVILHEGSDSFANLAFESVA